MREVRCRARVGEPPRDTRGESVGRAFAHYAGIGEEYARDAAKFSRSVVANDVDPWPGRMWLDVGHLVTLTPLTSARMDLAMSKGCDGVVPASVDAYSMSTGFSLSPSQQLTYNTTLSSKAYDRNVSVGLMNDIAQIAALEPAFDWALNEKSCECDLLVPFVAAGKAVFGSEYNGDSATYCPHAATLDLSWLTRSSVTGHEPPDPCPCVEPLTVKESSGEGHLSPSGTLDSEHEGAPHIAHGGNGRWVSVRRSNADLLGAGCGHRCFRCDSGLEFGRHVNVVKGSAGTLDTTAAL
jgi:hypothetical protein